MDNSKEKSFSKDNESHLTTVHVHIKPKAKLRNLGHVFRINLG